MTDSIVMVQAFAELRYDVVVHTHENSVKYGHSLGQTLFRCKQQRPPSRDESLSLTHRGRELYIYIPRTLAGGGSSTLETLEEGLGRARDREREKCYMELEHASTVAVPRSLAF